MYILFYLFDGNCLMISDINERLFFLFFLVSLDQMSFIYCVIIFLGHDFK